MKVIDVSAWNGAIDFIKVKKSGVGAVIIRAGYGSGHIDKRAHEYAKGAINAGLPFGLYWFSYAKSQQDARNEARAAVDFAKQYKISLPIYFDFEDDSAKFAKSDGVNVNNTSINAGTAYLERLDSKVTVNIQLAENETLKCTQRLQHPHSEYLLSNGLLCSRLLC